MREFMSKAEKLRSDSESMVRSVMPISIEQSRLGVISCPVVGIDQWNHPGLDEVQRCRLR
jgi:hypothetical protein